MTDLEFAALRPIQRHGSTPLWLQLKHALRDLITFDLRPGDQIPTEAQLCDAHSLSRVTVRQAITSLVDEGLLERRQGRGTFVLSPRLAESLGEQEHFLLNGFDAERPESVAVFSRETVPVPEWIAARLGLCRRSGVQDPQAADRGSASGSRSAPATSRWRSRPRCSRPTCSRRSA